MKPVVAALLLAVTAMALTSCQSGGQVYVGGDGGAHERLR